MAKNNRLFLSLYCINIYYTFNHVFIPCFNCSLLGYVPKSKIKGHVVLIERNITF